MVIRVLVCFVFLLLASGATGALAADGAALFGTHCAKCHGETGHADTPAGKMMKATALAGDAALAGAAEGDIVTKIKDNPKHAGLKGKLTDEELAAVAGHVKGLAGATK
jgi:mono/diheme cytochrome c family protein